MGDIFIVIGQWNGDFFYYLSIILLVAQSAILGAKQDASMFWSSSEPVFDAK
jgi:hypothetical protein